jgi:DNA-binding GntR family transcriptional regulator
VLEALRESIVRGRTALEAGDDARVADSLTEFSDVIAEASGNRRLASVLAELRSVLLLIGTSSLRIPGRDARSLDQHEQILGALDAGDPEAAAAATDSHILSIERDSIDAAAGAGEVAV